MNQEQKIPEGLATNPPKEFEGLPLTQVTDTDCPSGRLRMVKYGKPKATPYEEGEDRNKDHRVFFVVVPKEESYD